MLKVGIIGLGTVSSIHLLSINNSKYATLISACDINKNKLESKREQIKNKSIHFYTNYKEMLDKEDLDVVHICLPHYLHVEVSKYAVEKGIHVFCEKPVDVGYKKSKELDDFHKKLNNNTKIGICFQNRYNNTVSKLKEILKQDDNHIFAVKGIVSWCRTEEYYKSSPWRANLDTAGAGVIINQAIHTLDLCNYLSGMKWIRLKASTSALLGYDIEVEDTAVANIYYEDNIRGLFIATNAYSINDTVEVQVVTNKDKYTIKENRLYNRKYEILAEDEKSLHTKDYYGAGHENLINKFYKAILNDSEEYVNLGSALETMEMIDAIKVSSNHNKFVDRNEIIEF